MVNFSATEVAFTGFRFVREHPATIAVWAAIQLVISLGFGLLMTTMGGAAMTRFQSMSTASPADPTQTLAMIQQLLPMYGLMILFSIIFYPVLYAMMSRAVLRPGDSGMAYIRFGGDEWRQFLLMLLIVVVGIGAEIALVIGAIILSVIVRMVVPTAMPLVTLLIVIAAVCAAIFIGVRLSLASPLTFDTKRVNLFGSWRLTRGQFWKMFGTYLLVLVLAIVVEVLVMVICVAISAVLGGGLDGMMQMFRPDLSSIAAYFSPVRLAFTVLGALAAALIWPLFMMPPVEIYRELTTADEPMPTPLSDVP